MDLDYARETPRLEIRRLKVDEITEEYVAGLNAPEVNRYMEVRHHPQTRESIRNFVAGHWSDSGDLLFGVFTRWNGRLIGTVRLHGRSDYHFSAVIGMCLFAKDCWGKGYGSEAVREVVECGFQDLGLHYIEASCFEENQAAVAMFRKAGFEIKAVWPEKYRLGDRFTTVIILAAVNQAFDETKLKADG